MELKFETLLAHENGPRLTLTISRPHRANSINSTLIRELGEALDAAESSEHCRIVVLEGSPGVFCTGMDFQETATEPGQSAVESVRAAEYMNLLKRLALCSRIVIARLDGKVIAGGVGLAAASDLTIATARTEFSLSEALWGLLPCCVLPFLIRRVGFQKAYAMTLTTRAISAAEAHAIQLVDELTEDPDEALRKMSLRLTMIAPETVLDLKRYFQKMWFVSAEMERLAVDEITRLAAQPRVQQNIANYVTHRKFPWERT